MGAPTVGEIGPELQFPVLAECACECCQHLRGRSVSPAYNGSEQARSQELEDEIGELGGDMQISLELPFPMWIFWVLGLFAVITMAGALLAWWSH